MNNLSIWILYYTCKFDLIRSYFIFQALGNQRKYSKICTTSRVMKIFSDFILQR